MKILTIGSAMHDLFLAYDTPETITLEIDDCEVNYILLEEGRKIEIKNIHSHTGGGGTNSAISFTRLGYNASVIAKVGKDSDGLFIIESLKKRSINTHFIIQSPHEKTGCSYIIPSPTGNSALLVYRGANLYLNKKDIPLEQFAKFDYLYITSLSEKTSELLPIICKHASTLNIPIAANPGTSQLTANVQTLQDSLKAIDILILNCFEATLLMEQFNVKTKSPKKKQIPNRKLPDLLSAPINRGNVRFMLQEYFIEIHNRGPRIAVVTNGTDGVYVSDGGTIFYHPSLPIDCISTVGAGDAFASTFVAQLMQKKTISNAIRAGIINSASVLEYYDATSGLLDQKELDELIAEIDPEGIKKFDLGQKI